MDPKTLIMQFLYTYPFGKRYKSDLLDFLYIFSCMLQAEDYFKFEAGKLSVTSPVLTAAISELVAEKKLKVTHVEDSLRPGTECDYKHEIELNFEKLASIAGDLDMDGTRLKLMRKAAAHMFFLISYDSLSVALAARILFNHKVSCKDLSINIQPRLFYGISSPFDSSHIDNARDILCRLGFMSGVA